MIPYLWSYPNPNRHSFYTKILPSIIFFSNLKFKVYQHRQCWQSRMFTMTIRVSFTQKYRIFSATVYFQPRLYILRVTLKLAFWVEKFQIIWSYFHRTRWFKNLTEKNVWIWQRKMRFSFFSLSIPIFSFDPNFLCQSFFSLSISHFSLSKIDSETRTHRPNFGTEGASPGISCSWTLLYRIWCRFFHNQTIWTDQLVTGPNGVINKKYVWL